MNLFTKWCFRIGLICVALTFASEIVLFLYGIDAAKLALPESQAAKVVGLFIQVAMLMGIVLLVEAIIWLRRNWRHLSKPTKVVSVLGLSMTLFFGAYVFHWLLPSLKVGDSQGRKEAVG